VSQPSATLPEGERETPPPQAPASLFERLRPHFPWLLFAAALALRLWGIGWGLPDDKRHWSYHPDEPVLYAYSQQIEPAKLDFEPGFYNYGTLYLTLLRVTSDVARTYSNAGPVESGEPQIWMEMRTAHLGGRIVSALAGAGTAVVLFLMLRRRLGDPAALAGALVVAFAPGHVVHSRFQTVDVLAAFFLSLSALFALRLLPGGKKEAEDPPQPAAAMRQALWCGVFAGLSAGTKYTGILGLFTLFAAAAYLPRGRRLAPALAGAGAALAVFLLATPGAFLNSAKFLEDFRYEMQHTSQGHGLVFAGLPSGFFWHLYNLVIGVGPLLVLLGLGGAGAALRKGHPEAFALAAFALPYYLLIGRAEVLFLRYTFPLLILLAFGVAWLVRWSSDRGCPRSSSPGWEGCSEAVWPPRPSRGSGCPSLTRATKSKPCCKAKKGRSAWCPILGTTPHRSIPKPARRGGFPSKHATGSCSRQRAPASQDSSPRIRPNGSTGTFAS
jgi:hypothetical protein